MFHAHVKGVSERSELIYCKLYGYIFTLYKLNIPSAYMVYSYCYYSNVYYINHNIRMYLRPDPESPVNTLLAESLYVIQVKVYANTIITL